MGGKHRLCGWEPGDRKPAVLDTRGQEHVGIKTKEGSRQTENKAPREYDGRPTSHGCTQNIVDSRPHTIWKLEHARVKRTYVYLRNLRLRRGWVENHQNFCHHWGTGAVKRF